MIPLTVRETADLQRLALDGFPTVDDFSVELQDAEDLGKLVYYISATHGELAWFPAWEHAERDMRHFTPEDVPNGTIDLPFDDRDEAWRILIFENGGYVYVLEADDPAATNFPRFFRVSAEQYAAAWLAVLYEYRAVVDLGDEEEGD